MASLKYWLWLQSRARLTPARIHALFDRFSSPNYIYLSERDEFEKIKGLSSECIDSLCDKSMDYVEQLMNTCVKQNIQILCMQDAQYPERLKQIYNPPLALFVRGNLPDIDDEAAISFVGTRKCSIYGIQVTQKIAGEIASCGGLIVSGMALGVDTVAHEAALYEGAKTIAVLGCGVDVVYPQQNVKLMHKIIDNGAVISEYPPGTRPDGAHFPARNRIISGLSLGVVVAEAPEHSGALITASLATDQNRDVFAIPGNITNLCSVGTNALIRDGAKPVQSGADVLQEYIQMFPHRLRIHNSETPHPVRKEEIKKCERNAALEALISKYRPEEQNLLRAIGTERTHVDMIISQSGMSAPHVLSLLTVFEISGVVRQHVGKYFEIVIES